MKFKNPFKRNYASPYYGGNGALFQGSAVPLRKEPKTEMPKELEPITTPVPVRFTPTSTAPDWEQRRFELFKMLIAQERRSVVLGKLQANDKQIAAKARSITDYAIMELQRHPFKSHDDDEGRTENAE